MRGLIVIVIALSACKRVDDPADNVLAAEFSANHPELGTWTARPTGCEDGRDYGFKGIVFRFALPARPPAPAEAPAATPPSRIPATAPEEIRLDLARNGDNVIELRYPDRDGTVRRVRERECASITGAVHRTERGPSRPVRVRGTGSFECPAFGLRGRFEVDGCLPAR